MSERGQYEIVPRPKPFRPSAEPDWPVDAILATATSGDAVRVPHEKQATGSQAEKKKSGPRAKLLNLIRNGLKRRGYAMEWAAAGDAAVDVWAVKNESK